MKKKKKTNMDSTYESMNEPYDVDIMHMANGVPAVLCYEAVCPSCGAAWLLCMALNSIKKTP